MALIPVRDLRNHTAEVIERARAGEDVTITVHGVAVAKLTPATPGKREYLTKEDLLAFRSAAPDTALAADLAAISEQTTDDLGPVR